MLTIEHALTLQSVCVAVNTASVYSSLKQPHLSPGFSINSEDSHPVLGKDAVAFKDRRYSKCLVHSLVGSLLMAEMGLLRSEPLWTSMSIVPSQHSCF